MAGELAATLGSLVPIRGLFGSGSGFGGGGAAWPYSPMAYGQPTTAPATTYDDNAVMQRALQIVDLILGAGGASGGGASLVPPLGGQEVDLSLPWQYRERARNMRLTGERLTPEQMAELSVVLPQGVTPQTAFHGIPVGNIQAFPQIPGGYVIRGGTPQLFEQLRSLGANVGLNYSGTRLESDPQPIGGGRLSPNSLTPGLDAYLAMGYTRATPAPASAPTAGGSLVPHGQVSPPGPAPAGFTWKHTYLGADMPGQPARISYWLEPVTSVAPPPTTPITPGAWVPKYDRDGQITNLEQMPMMLPGGPNSRTPAEAARDEWIAFYQGTGQYHPQYNPTGQQHTPGPISSAPITPPVPANTALAPGLVDASGNRVVPRTNPIQRRQPQAPPPAITATGPGVSPLVSGFRNPAGRIDPATGRPAVAAPGVLKSSRPTLAPSLVPTPAVNIFELLNMPGGA